MQKKKISQDNLRALIAAEAAKDPLCEDLTKVQLFGTEDDSAGNWTVAWHGLGFDRAANAAMAAIIKRLSAEYDVAWRTQH
jgi:anti-sigma-K factor RskA